MNWKQKRENEKMGREGIKGYFLAKKDELAIILADKNQNLRRLEAQRNELNAKGTNRCRPSAPHWDRVGSR